MWRPAVIWAMAIILPATITAAPAEPIRKETPRERLSGVWELRADDGRTGQLILNPNGRLAAASSSGSNRMPDYEGQWSLIREDDNRFVLEFGKAPGSPDSYRVTLVLTCRDAFTLLETIKNGTAIREQHRFIRVARVAPKPP
jgi:hypothetical protein